MSRRTVAAAVLMGCLGLLACEDVPVRDISGSFAVEVSQLSKSEGAIKLDILWVIDNSASMSQEQTSLAESYRIFVDQLKTYLKNIDVRLAVTTMNVADEGQFVTKSAKTFPPAAIETKVWPCLGHADCEKKYGKGWECKSYPAKDMYNTNGSINSTCTLRCDTDPECCGEFCFEDDCKGNESCLNDKCKDLPNEDCAYYCRDPGTGSSSNGCLRKPDTDGCPAKSPEIMSMSNIEDFRCIAIVQQEQAYSANIEQGLRTSWMALDPEGPNPDQYASFVRDDAYLVIVYVTDEDDCSIDDGFGAPNHTCGEGFPPCPEGSTCKLDKRLSQIKGKETKLCFGAIKKDYYNVCALLGEYRGETHHQQAYDLTKGDCSADEDCEYGWECKGKKCDEAGSKCKCRPSMFELPNIATYQQPPGFPIYSLTPVDKYYSRLRSLKSDPAKVLIAVIAGDGNVKKDDKKSLISDECMGMKELPMCQAYGEAKDNDVAGCDDDPGKEGCEAFSDLKLACIRDCYVTSKGEASGTVSKNTYICETPNGKADWGSRYIKLAQMFGPNGIVSNICSPEGIAPALQTIAELIIKRVTKICLPLPIAIDPETKKEEEIVVLKTVPNADGTPGKPVRLVKGDAPDGQYKIEFPTQACCDFDEKTDECRGTLKAIVFNDVLEPDALIEVKYEAGYGEPEVK